eukprot:Phypoly_transcript_18546.p2 GENE.Phypoly_transcript_18546~~Phypoly_transcript_18546.p2  ORF type:complete len:206 (+),score=41.66 Phypoly_transcript_18546:92-709(+)
MKVILLLALCVAVALAATPTRPDPPESYEARVRFDIENRTARIHTNGDGFVARDFTGNRAVRHAYFDERERPFIIYELARWDLKQEYFLDNHNWTQCHNESITGSIFPEWSWLANATYDGTHNNVDFWNNTEVSKGYTFRVGAGFQATGNTTAPTVPVFQVVEVITGTSFERTTIQYQEFRTAVNQDDFIVPKQCGGTAMPFFLW